MFDLTTATVLYYLLMAAFILGLRIYYDRRDHARFEAECRRTIFHCLRCGEVYAKLEELTEGECPSCEYINGGLRF